MPYKVGDKIVYRLGELRGELPVRYLKEREVQDYATLLAECATKNKQWEDPEFDPYDKNYDIIGKVIDGTDVFVDKDKKKIPQIWTRIKEFDKKAVFAKPDKNGKLYSRSDLSQGRIGDCFYLSALNIVTGRPDLINFIIPEDNKEGEKWGIYHFRFWLHGNFFDIIVDDRIPTAEHKMELVDGAGKSMGYTDYLDASGAKAVNHEYWPMLIEKAFAKLYGCYGYIDGGQTDEALEHFTGGLVLSAKFAERRPNWQSLLPTEHYEIFLGLAGRARTGNREIDENEDPVTGLFRGHAYAVVDLVEVIDKSGQPLQLLRVKNPHGRNEWKLDWSDKYCAWKAKKTKNFPYNLQ